jgi:hypothetical protein
MHSRADGPTASALVISAFKADPVIWVSKLLPQPVGSGLGDSVLCARATSSSTHVRLCDAPVITGNNIEARQIALDFIVLTDHIKEWMRLYFGVMISLVCIFNL